MEGEKEGGMDGGRVKGEGREGRWEVGNKGERGKERGAE